MPPARDRRRAPRRERDPRRNRPGSEPARADEIDDGDHEPRQQIAAGDEPCCPGRQSGAIGRSDGGKSEEKAVNRAVEPSAEAADLAARACDQPVGDVAQDRRHDRDAERVRRENRQQRNGSCSQQGDRVRDAEAGQRAAVRALEHAQVPLGHEEDEQPPR
jgi:hypothetical protein